MTTTNLHLPAHLVPGPGKVPVTLRIDRLIGQNDLFARWVDPDQYEPVNQDHRVYAAHTLLSCGDETVRVLCDAKAEADCRWGDQATVTVAGAVLWEGDAEDLYDVLTGWEE